MPKRVNSSGLIVQSKKIAPASVRPSFTTAPGQGILSKLTNFKDSKKIFIIGIVIILLIALFFFKRGWFIAATVNGSPITTFEFLSQMNRQYHEQVLTQLINEKIIKSEIEKSGVSVSQSDIDKSISQIELSVGGAAALDGMLSQQGQTRAGLREQLKLQLALEKMYAKEASVPAEEISQYIEENESRLTATDSAGQTKEAEEALKQQKLQKIFSEKFQEFKNKAKVVIY